jgi:hypothetical protein
VGARGDQREKAMNQHQDNGGSDGEKKWGASIDGAGTSRANQNEKDDIESRLFRERAAIADPHQPETGEERKRTGGCQTAIPADEAAHGAVAFICLPLEDAKQLPA